MIVTASITALALVCCALIYEIVGLKRRVDHAVALADDIQIEFSVRQRELTRQVADLSGTADTLIESVKAETPTLARINDAIARIDRAIAAHPTQAAQEAPTKEYQ